MQKYPDWKHGLAYKKGGFEFVEFPLIYTHEVNIIQGKEKYDAAKANKIIDAAITRIVFIKSSGGKIDVRIVNMMPTYDYASAKGFDISQNNATLLDENFCGTIQVRKWDETVIQAQHIVNRKIKSKFKIADAAMLQLNARAKSEVCIRGHWEGIWIHVCFEQYTEMQGDVPTVIACSHGSGPNTHIGDIFVCDEYGEEEDDEDDAGPCDGIYEPQAQADCICAYFGIGCGDDGGDGGGGGPTKEELTIALANGVYETVPSSDIYGSPIPIGADEYEASHIFELGKYKIPVWVTYTFTAYNKVLLKKVNANSKKITGYIFGETKKSGSSIFYACSTETLAGSSVKNIVANGTNCNGMHWYSFEINLIDSNLPIPMHNEQRGTSFNIYSSSY